MANKKAGIIVARFQVSNLHEGHRKLIDTALEECDKVWIFLGISKEFDKENPLSYEIRKDMIKSIYNDDKIIINPLWDKESHYEWSSNLDNYLEVLDAVDWKITLYGGRLNFSPFYTGKYKDNFKEIKSIENVSGSLDRYDLTTYRSELNTEDFRKGVIHAYQNIIYSKD